MPLEVLKNLRHRLSVLERSVDTLQVHPASERTQGFVEALEVLKPGEIESLYLIMEDASQARLKALLL